MKGEGGTQFPPLQTAVETELLVQKSYARQCSFSYLLYLISYLLSLISYLLSLISNLKMALMYKNYHGGCSFGPKSDSGSG